MTTSAPFFISEISSEIDPPPTQQATCRQRERDLWREMFDLTHSEIEDFDECLDLGVDLIGQLTSWRHDHCDGTFSASNRTLVLDMTNERK
jgi:hypothetical protein